MPRDRPPELEVEWQFCITCGRQAEWRMTLEITEVRISLREDDKLKAFASMTFNDAFVIRGLKIIEGTNGMFVAMPSRKRPDGTYQDVAHPINNETRKFIEDRILDEYERERSKQQPSLIGTTL